MHKIFFSFISLIYSYTNYTMTVRTVDGSIPCSLLFTYYSISVHLLISLPAACALLFPLRHLFITKRKPVERRLRLQEGKKKAKIDNELNEHRVRNWKIKDIEDAGECKGEGMGSTLRHENHTHTYTHTHTRNLSLISLSFS